MKIMTCLAMALFTLSLAACGGGNESNLSQTFAASECGGFPSEADDASYCDAEVLSWTFLDGVLTLTHARFSTSCGSPMEIAIAEDGQDYLVTESIEDSMADCVCTYDLRLEVTDMPEGTIHLKLVRDITNDQGPAYDLWEGDLDLTAGSGEITLSTEDLTYCG
jgi:hypothetical protein